jgi:HTH-type transcriptional regulator, quorum sensing regulator NprR
VLLELDVEERNRLIGKNLRKYRLLKGLTQDELAAGLCSVSQLSKVENGKTYINRTMLRQMADRLGVTAERIEAADALLEELTDQLQLAKDAQTAGNFDKAYELVREVVAKSREFGYANLLIEGVLTECRLLVRMQQYQKGIETASRALEEGVPQTSTQKVQLLYELGHSYQQIGNVIAAYDCYTRADEEFEGNEGNEEILLPVLFNLAQCHYWMRNIRTAVRYAEKAERIAQKLSKFMYRIRLTYMKAGYLVGLGETEKAEAIFMSVLKEAQANSLLLDEAIIHDNLGEMFIGLKEYGQAQTHLKRAESLFQLLEEKMGHVTSLLHFAELHIDVEDYDIAREYIDKSLGIVSTIEQNSYRQRAKAFQLLARLNLAHGDFESYVVHMEAALQEYDQYQVMIEAYDVASELADQLYQRNDPRALEMYRRAAAYNKKSLEFGMRR